MQFLCQSDRGGQVEPSPRIFKGLGASLASASGVRGKGVTREGYLKGQYATEFEGSTALDCNKVQGFMLSL
jgi:hypothetical protein